MDYYREEFLSNFGILFVLSKIASNQRGIDKKFMTTTGDVAQTLGVSQQTASRRLEGLFQTQLIQKTRKSSGLELKITPKGIKILYGMLEELKLLLGIKIKIKISGFVTSGLGEGSYYVSKYMEAFEIEMGGKPYPGTLNLRLKEMTEIEKLEIMMKTIPSKTIPGFVDKGRKFGAVDFWSGFLVFRDQESNDREIKALLIRPHRTHHPSQLIEIVASPNLRETFGLEDEDLVTWILVNTID
ncbi:MAG: DUF120 domain-containing protein [Candidatus Hodarchaeales archaeon]|jgi:riboflavin kinase